MVKKLLLTVLVAAPMCMAAQTAKFAVINSQEVFNLMPEKAAAEATLKAEGEKYQAEMAKMQEEFQAKYKEYEALMNDANSSDLLKQTKLTELQDLSNRGQQFQQTVQQALQQKQAELLAPISDKLMNAINEVGKDGGYVLVEDLTSNSVIYYGANAENIQEKVKAKLGLK